MESQGPKLEPQQTGTLLNGAISQHNDAVNTAGISIKFSSFLS